MKTVQFSDEIYDMILERLTERFYMSPDYQECKKLTAAITQMGAELNNGFFRLLQKIIQTKDERASLPNCREQKERQSGSVPVIKRRNNER